MAEAVILRVIKKLESWASAHMRGLDLHSRRSVEPMKEIFDELRVMENFLRDNKLGGVSRVNYLIGDVVDMVQDIVDLTEADIRWKLTNEIELTREWMRETRMRMLEPLIVTIENAGEGGEDEGDVVGLEEDAKVLLERAIFNEEEKGLSTLVVKGMPGIGKTALARQLYNHASVVGRFECRAWVCLSSELTNKEVLMKIIQQVDANSLLEKMERADNESLQQMLRQHLQGMPYFIVIDNVLKGMRYVKSVLKCLSCEGMYIFVPNE